MRNRLKRVLATATVAAAIAAGAWLGFGGELQAGGENRTLSLYHTHTRESLTVTYMVNGRYVPSALKKINVLMRDWRRNEVIRIDPKTIDLMWELHADLGSKRPIHIICGYRSPKTNGFLKRIGRGVAKKSQHMVGKAIDLYFPDVSTAKIRNSAMVRKVGGVGYYRSSGPSGFVHIDSGKVRHWPRISAGQYAQIMREGSKTVGRRLNGKNRIVQEDVVVASRQESKKKVKIDETLANAPVYEGVDDEDDAVETVAAKVPEPRAKPATSAEIAEVASESYPVPTPRNKPIEILMLAAADMTFIEPAAAPPPERTNFAKKPSPVADSLGVVEGAETLIEEPTQFSNASAKGSFAEALREGTAEGMPMIKPLTASAAGGDIAWWPSQLVFSPDQAVRRDGSPRDFVTIQGLTAAAAEPEIQIVSTGKADMLVVNRSSKGSLLMDQPVTLQKRQKVGQLEQ